MALMTVLAAVPAAWMAIVVKDGKGGSCLAVGLRAANWLGVIR
jgi:hypothetical protein